MMNTYRRIYFTGIAAYVIMLILSILFYKERGILLDSAYDLFHLLRGEFDVNVVRFAGILPKLPPYFAIKEGLPLNTVLISYSVANVAYYFALYVICGGVLKRYDVAIGILLCNILFVTECFYYMPSELPQGLAFLLFTIACIPELGKTKALHWVVVPLCAIGCAFFHPLMLFAVGYAIVFFLLRKGTGMDRRMLYLFACVFVVFILLKMFVIRSQYEQQTMGVLGNFVRLFPNYFAIHANKAFFIHCFTRYYWMPLVCAGTATVYVRNKEWKRLVFFGVSVLGYIAIVNVSYPYINTPTFYIENLYLPLGLFLTLPFIYDLLPVLVSRQIAVPVVAAIIVTGCVRIYIAHNIFTERLTVERELIKQYGDKKIIISSKHVPLDILQMTWGAPYEFLLLSVSDGDKPASIIIDDKPIFRTTERTKTLIVNWNMYTYDEVNPRYFHFADTTTGYVTEEAGTK